MRKLLCKFWIWLQQFKFRKLFAKWDCDQYKPPEPPTLPEFKKVWVLICTDTGYEANSLCPRTEWKEFVIGTIPTECERHKAPKKTEFDMNLSYQETGNIFGAFNCKGGLFLKANHQDHYREKDFRQFIDEVAKADLANVIRMFLWYNAGDAKNDQINMPHPVMMSGQYDLHSWNYEWRDQVVNRLDYMANKQITIELKMVDQSSVNRWYDHWLCKDRNLGWNRCDTYPDRHGFFKWVHYAKGHPLESLATPEEVEAYTATELYLFDQFYPEVRRMIDPYKDWIILSNNEVDSRVNWHYAMEKLFESWGFPRSKRITSVRKGALEWFHTGRLGNGWMPQIHSIFTMDDYLKMEEFLRSPYFDETGGLHDPVEVPVIPCGDGGGEIWWMEAGADGIADILERSIKDGNLGYLGNTEGEWDRMDYTVARKMRDKFKKVLGL